jgi:hypothetical protein
MLSCSGAADVQLDLEAISLTDELQTCKTLVDKAATVLSSRDRAVAEHEVALADMRKLHLNALAEQAQQHTATMLDLSSQQSSALMELRRQLDAASVQLSESQSKLLASQQVSARSHLSV